MTSPHHSQRPKEYTRYCPGEEQIRISDAVCLGRRRGNFPKCRGCQFNDDEKAVAQGHPVSVALAIAGNKAVHKAAAPPPDPIESIFKANDIRATSPDPLDRDMAWRIGYASAQFLRSELRGYDRGRTDKSTVIVGRDVRRTSPDLAAGLIDGLRRGGSPVIDIGLIDTPQLYFAVNRLDACGGVMVTASHNPPQYNGFKICGQRAKPVSVDTGLAKISKIAQNTLRQSGTSQAACEPRDFSGEYKAFVRAFLREEGTFADGDRPLKIVVDASNGMAGRWFPVIFGDVDWMEIVPLNFEHAGDFVHDPDPLVETNLRQLCDRMIRSKADLGICFDGDADRCIFVDEQGQIVRGDWLTALLIPVFLRQMPAATVVYDLRSSLVVPEEIRKAGGTPRRERCGHAFIKKALADARGIFAGELSGHYYFRDNFYCDSAMIAVAEVVNLLNRTGKPLSELIAPLKRYVCSGEHSFPCAHPRAVLDLLADRYATGRVDFLDGVTVQYRDWWFNLRPSITEPKVRLNVEARDPATLQQRLHELTELIEQAAG